jgi:hypothetical protein
MSSPVSIANEIVEDLRDKLMSLIVDVYLQGLKSGNETKEDPLSGKEPFYTALFLGGVWADQRLPVSGEPYIDVGDGQYHRHSVDGHGFDFIYVWSEMSSLEAVSEIFEKALGG